MVPFVRSCLGAQHEAMVAGPGELAASAEMTGALFWPVDDPPQEAMAEAFDVLRALPHEEANAWMVAEIFGRLRSTSALPRLGAAIREWRPDVVIRESAEFGAAVAAELHGIPHARIGIGLGAMEEYCVTLGAAPVDELRHLYGLAGDPGAERLRKAPFLTLFPAGLEDRAVENPLHTLRFRDPAWDAYTVEGTTGCPLLYVTFGTVTAQLPAVAAVYTEALRAVEDFEGEVLMTVGRETDPSAFGTPPANVQVERWVNQASVLPRAAAVVCHGGGGSTLGALAAGVPLVVVPLFAEDQHINARQVAAVGAGVSAAHDAESIRSGLQAVLHEPSYRAKAESLATELRSQACIDDAPAVLATFGLPACRQAGDVG